MGEDTQDCILGNIQPSLRDWFVLANPCPGLHPGPLSAVPSGLKHIRGSSHNTLQPCPYKTTHDRLALTLLRPTPIITADPGISRSVSLLRICCQIRW